MRGIRNNFYYLSLCLILINCTKPTPEEKLTGEILIESLPARLIGGIAVEDSKLYLTKPFANQGLVEVWDIAQGIKLDSGGVKGGGPDQVAQAPFMVGLVNNYLTIFDGNKMLRYTKDNLAVVETIKIQIPEHDIIKIINTEGSRYLGLDLSQEKPLTLFSPNKKLSVFGDFPVGENETVNKQNVFQGKLYYNAGKKMLLHAYYDVGYFTLHQMNDDNPSKLLEKQYFNYDYQMLKNNLIWNKNNSRGAVDGLITKDYIVLLIFDGAKTGFMVNNYETTPENLLIFDLEGELIKKIKLDKKVLRLANTGKDNILYCIGFNPDFCLVKYEL